MLEGPPVRLEECVVMLRAIAPLIFHRPMELREVERETIEDRDGRGACWAMRAVDGEVQLVGVVGSGEGNPRDGYGYTISARLLAPWRDKPSWWRAELYGSNWEPCLVGVVRLHLIDLDPAQFDAIRARAIEAWPNHRDVTDADPHAVREQVESFDASGHHERVRALLAAPLRDTMTWVSAALCARRTELLGPDAVTARTWVSREPHASRGWSALADAGGDATTSEGDARMLAALTNPFSTVAIERAAITHPTEASALAAAISHVFLDPAWRWLDVGDRDAYAARVDAWQPSASESAIWERPGHVLSAALDREIATFFDTKDAVRLETSYVHTGPPLAERGSLSHQCGIGTGHSVRRAIVEQTPIAARSRVVAACQINAEDRLACFGLVWLDATRHVVWRYVVHAEGERLVRSPITFHVIDRATDDWGVATAASLTRAAASR